jgi:crossover junction endodeoxyribonuclease RusA
MTIDLLYPPSVNRLWRYGRGRAYKSKVYKDWLIEGELTLRQLTLECFECPVSVEMAVGRPDKRRRDLDNIVKPCLDLLEKVGVFEDDSQVHRLNVYWGGQKGVVTTTILPIAHA